MLRRQSAPRGGRLDPVNRNLFGRDVMFAAVVALLLAACACRPEGEATVPAPANPAPAGGTAPAEVAVARRPFDAAAGQSLVSWWLRHDQGYMLVVEAVATDGRLTARYLNPQPVNVSKAEAWNESGEIRLLVELSDRNYPGSFYELAYRKEEEMLVGVYHNLQVGQEHEVSFTRFEPDESAPR